jgi:hypothetical protein
MGPLTGDLGGRHAHISGGFKITRGDGRVFGEHHWHDIDGRGSEHDGRPLQDGDRRGAHIGGGIEFTRGDSRVSGKHHSHDIDGRGLALSKRSTPRDEKP